MSNKKVKFTDADLTMLEIVVTNHIEATTKNCDKLIENKANKDLVRMFSDDIMSHQKLLLKIRSM